MYRGVRRARRACSIPGESRRGLPRLWRAAPYLLSFPGCFSELGTLPTPVLPLLVPHWKGVPRPLPAAGAGGPTRLGVGVGVGG